MTTEERATDHMKSLDKQILESSATEKEKAAMRSVLSKLHGNLSKVYEQGFNKCRRAFERKGHYL
ncbi:hypothetical protein [Larkinella rosea]|uniref:Uncharacterized protein n=1 Tax=Larkinella rosea TaxID=2025312 RepID=A0A3P1BGA4_9BACT|nr:hypothetical protein [Larkinella rosea]RRB00130.1 hypothetical protein EHT25_26260 [Larkinella rosea]